MVKPKKIFVLWLLSLLLLTGCWDRKELEETAFVMAIGFDKGEKEGEITATAMIAIPTRLGGAGGGGGGGGGGEGAPVMVAKQTGRTYLEALYKMRSQSDRPVDYNHSRLVVISEDLAKSGIADMLEVLTRQREMRRTMVIIVVQGKAEDFLKLQPDQEKSPARYVDSLLRSLSSEVGQVPYSELHSFWLNLWVSKSAYAAYLAPKKESDKTSDESGGDGQTKKDEGKPKTIQSLGTALFAGTKMVGTFDEQQTRAMLLLQRKFRESLFVIPDPRQSQKHFAVNVRLTGYRNRFTGTLDRPAFSVKLAFEADIAEIESRENWVTPQGIAELEAAVSREIKKQVEETIAKAQKLKVDPFDFGEIVREYSRPSQWKKYNWLECFAKSAVKVEVHTSIRRNGFLFEPPPLRK